MSSQQFMILNGELLHEEIASISPLNRGNMYGDGCFETFKSYSGRFLRWKQHFKRLEEGLSYLDIQTPFSATDLKDQVKGLLEHNLLLNEEAMVRIQCWRAGERGYFTDSTEAHWMIQASKVHPQKKSLSLAVAETRAIPSEALERKYKLSNGLNYIKAAGEARRSSCDDSLMLTVDNKISETTSANIFWVNEDKIFTPDLDCDLLPGVTRSLVIDTIQSLGILVEQGKYELADLQKSEAVFCTNSLIEIAEVHSLGEIEFEIDHPLVMKIKVAFEQLKVKELSE